MADDIKIAIEAIDRRIASLREIRDRLIAEFPSLQSGPNGSRREGLTRKQEAVNLLRTSGPMHRKDLRATLGWPLGTVSYVLDDKKLFRRRDDGRYELREEGKQ